MPQQEMISRISERMEQQFFGKYRGVVKDNKDPLKLGRLKIQVPSVLVDDPLTDDDESVTDWASPCVPCGGASEQGFFFVPDKEANVWVEFEEGNIDQPIWVGTFWTAPKDTTQIPTEAQDMAGTEQDLEPKRRVLKTTSGHVLEFCDIAGKESITMQHKDGAMINMDEKGSVTLINKKGSLLYLNADAGELSLIDENGNNIATNSDGVTITSQDGSIVGLGKDAVQVIAKNVHIRSQTVSLGEGAMEPAILGKTFAAIFDAHTHATTAPGAPTSPPIPAPMPLSAPMNPAISTCVKVK
jgi:hypothetical protein